MVQWLLPPWVGIESRNTSSPLSHGEKKKKRVLKTLCSEQTKHFIVNHFGIHLIHLHFCIELDCSQERWTHSWGSRCVKPEHVFSSDNLRACGLNPNLGSSFNMYWDIHHELFSPSQARTDLLHWRWWDLEEKARKKRSEWIILQTGLRLLICFNGLYCDCCSIQDRDSCRRTLSALCKCLWQAVSCFAPAWSCLCLVHLVPVPSSRLLVLHLSNPLRPGRTTSSLYPSNVASPVLGIQHFLPQKCFELDNEIWGWLLFVCLFVSHSFPSTAMNKVQYNTDKWKKQQKAVDLYRVRKAHV